MASSDVAGQPGRSANSPDTADTAFAVLAGIAVVLPTLIAFNVAPSATFFNQAAAFVGWGGFLLVLGSALAQGARPHSSGSWALLGAIAILVLAALGASVWAGAPWPLSLSSAGTLLSAALTVAVAACVSRAGLGEQAFRAFCIALVVAGIASSAIGLVQVFAPNLPDGDWIAPASIPGRATGNLRQPNHLSSLLLWSVVAAVWLGEARVIYREIGWMLALLFIEVIVLSASRTGLLGMATLLGWGLFDRRLSRPTRVLLLAAPLAYLALWEASTLWAHHTHLAFGGEERLSGSGLYVSYSRYKIWWNSLALIAQHPWLGVGFGEFNFAWTLTPFPDRPVAFFDHAHNLMLQFAVELGVPLMLVLTALFLFALWQAMRFAIADGRGPGARFTRLFGPADAGSAATAAASTAESSRVPMQRAAFVMVVMVGVHSLLEYPLWYAYFLLPAAFAFGLSLERPDVRDTELAAADRGNVTRPFVIASMALILCGTLALYDYMRVVIIFAPPADAAPLDKRIADGRRSILFAHHADYAAATVVEHPSKVMKAFQRAPHFLLDARLMMAWARALDEKGETDKARYVAQRLKEFHNDQAEEFFAPCAAAPAASAPASAASAAAPARLPFQCLAPERKLSFKDFR
ncbi:MAG: Wzy polymerase domain-containing protein [Caldimonas sp.]